MEEYKWVVDIGFIFFVFLVIILIGKGIDDIIKKNK